MSQTATRTMSSPWLSILIPAYNVAPFVRACLESAASQSTAGDIEIIIVDDKSTDDTFHVVQRFSHAYPTGLIKLKHQEKNVGLSATRNHMLEMASGTYVWFLDADDRLQDGAVAALKTIALDQDPDLIICDFSILRPFHTKRQLEKGELHRKVFDGIPRELSSDRQDLLKGLLSAGQMHSWSKIAKRRLWDHTLRFPEGRYFEDLATTPLLAMRTKTYYYEPSPWVQYRQSSGSILATMTGKKYVDLMQALAEVSDCLSADPEPLSDDVLFECRLFCARHFIGCAKDHLRAFDSHDRLETLGKCYSYQTAIVDDDWAFAKQAIRRGHFWRWLRYKKWKWHVQRALGR
ncbi:glycosyltransferase family A protein [Corticibacterium sp. UT-5YL-CI-8]|nr:glycosyltransferase family A protein [Tianweitania sp. UT-5YL-CI-8]